MPTPLRPNGGNIHSHTEREEKMRQVLQWKAQGMSQSAMAKKLRVSQGTLSRWLNRPEYATVEAVGKTVAKQIREELGADGEPAAQIAEQQP